MKKVPLYGKHGRGQVALVDDSDFVWAMRYRWRLNNCGYCIRDVYDPVTKKSLARLMHRELLRATSGLVDHKDHNRLNNQRSNIRACDFSQNVINRVTYRKRTKYRGVIPMSHSSRRWQARICNKHQVIHLGSFASEEDAARAYNKAAQRLFGDFAILNEVA